ncbi:MAG: alpha/beta hydrolase family protein [Planctomycetota bacterium]
MALAHLHYWSPALQKQCGMFVAMPDAASKPRPVVYLLHGLSDDHTMWQRRSSIERYAERCGLIVVMPDGARSFYTNAADGSGNYEQHILDSIAYVERTLHCRSDRAARGIGGLSMGGYGALKIALKHPELFSSVAIHSAPLDIDKCRISKDRKSLFNRVFGPAITPTEDCFALVRKLKRMKTRFPRLRIDCGTEDGLIGHNDRMHALLKQLGVEHHYGTPPGGHDWEYWDLHVQSALEFHRDTFAGISRRVSHRRRAKA